MGKSHCQWALLAALVAAFPGCKGAELPAQSQFVGTAGGDAVAAVDGSDGGADTATEVAGVDADAGPGADLGADVAPDVALEVAQEVAVEVAPDDADATAEVFADVVPEVDVLDAGTEIDVAVDAATDAQADAADAADDVTAVAVDATDAGETAQDIAADTAADAEPETVDVTATADAGDAATDAAVDVAVDVGVDVAPDVIADVAPDVPSCVDPCGNDEPCTVNFKCQAGKCVGTPKNCNDGNACTDDSCDPVKGCQNVNSGAACEDGFACTVGDSCKLGACAAGVPAAFLTTAGAEKHEEFYGVAARQDGGAWAVGFRESLGMAWIARTDASGKVIVDKAIDLAGDQVLRRVVAETSGGGTAVGYTGSEANWDAWFARFDAQGAILAQKTFDGPTFSQFYDLAIAGTSYYGVGSTAEGSVGGLDAWVVKLDGAGNVAWQKTFGTAGSDYATAVRTRPDGGLIAVGTVGKPVSNGPTDHWMVWLSATGQVERQAMLGAPEAGRLDGVAATPAAGSLPSGYFVAGARGATLNLTDGWVGRVDDNGTVLWHTAVAATSGHDICYGVVAMPDGGCMVTCSTGFGPATGGAVVVVRLDLNGNVQWQRSTAPAGSLHTFSNADVIVDAAGAPAGLLFGGQVQVGDGTTQAVIARANLWGYTGCTESGQCAAIAPSKCDDGKPCTADDCANTDGTCKNTNHTGGCDAKGCTVGDGCFGGQCTASSKAKLWEKVHDPGGGELFARRIIVPASGDRVIGAYQGISGADSRVIAHGLDGSVLWNVAKPKTSSGVGIVTKDLAQLSDGRVAVLGASNSNAGFALMFDSNGKNLTDIAASTGMIPEAICACPGGGWWIAGYTPNEGAGVLQRFSAEGQSIINKSFDGVGKESFTGLWCLPGGAAIASGQTASKGSGGDDAWLLWVDGGGNQVGEAVVGGAGTDYCVEVVGLADGSAVCAGGTSSKGKGGVDGYVVHAAPNGAVLWQHVSGSAGGDAGYDLVAVPGGFAVAGYQHPGLVYDPAANSKPWLLRLDANGNKLNEVLLGTSEFDAAYSLTSLPDGSLVVAGTRGSASKMSAWTARLDPWGAPTCAASGLCAGTAAVSCIDADPCTLDTCDPLKGCVQKPAAEHTVCASGKTCQKGQCAPGAPPKCLANSDCDDQNACTDDICDPAKGCSNVPNSKACDDSDPCTNDACTNGKCVGTPAWSYYTNGGGPGADQMYGVTGTQDGGWVTVGTRNDAKQGWVVRFGSDGKVVWDKGLTPSSGQRRYGSVIANADGTFTAVGDTYFGGASYDALVTRISADGSEISSVDHKGVGLDQFFSAVPVATGWIAVGGTGPSNGDGQDGWVVGLDKQGNKLWEKTSGLAKEDRFWGATAAGPDEVLAIGTVAGPDGKRQGWAVWYDAAGNLLRDRRYGSSASRTLNGAAGVSADGGFPAGYLLVGAYGDQPTNHDGLVVRTDLAGQVVWQKNFAASPKNDSLSGVAVWEGGLAVAGYRNNSDTDNFGAAVWLGRLDWHGNLQWDRSVTDNGNLHAFSGLLAQPASHPAGAGLVVAGQFISNGKDQQGMVLRVNAMGFATCASAGKCAGKATNACDDGNACTADDCNQVNGACQQTPHVGTCEGNQCTGGDSCLAGSCKSSAKPKLWEKSVDPGAAELYPRAAIRTTGGLNVIAMQGIQPGAESQAVAYSDAGDVAWSFKHGSNGGVAGIAFKSVVELADGRLLFPADGYQNGAHPYYLIVDQAGTVVTSKLLAESGVTETAAADPNGGWWLAGYTSGAADGIVRHFKADGTMDVDKSYGGTGNDYLNGAVALPGGGLAATGSSGSSSKGMQDAWLLVVDGAGNQNASVVLGGPDNDGWHYSVALGADGNLATAGTFGSLGYVGKFSQAGQPLWQKTYGDKPGSRFDGIGALGDGGCLLAGSQPQQGKYPDGVSVPWLVRIDATGTVVWQKTLPSTKWAEMNAVAVGPDGLSVWTGWRGQGKDFDTFAVRVDSWGNTTCAASGVCASVPQGTCKDGAGPCTSPGCDPKKGCAAIVKEDGSACDDGKPCSVNDLCFGGSCEAGEDGLWDKPFGTAKLDQFSAVAAHPDGRTVAAGRTLNTAAGNPNAWLTALGLDGKPLWSKTVSATQWSGSASDNVVFYDVVALSDGGALAAGMHIPASPGTTSNALLYRVDNKGDFVKSAAIPSPGSNYFGAVAVSDNTVWAAGRQSQNGGDGWVQSFGLDSLTAGTVKTTVGGASADWFNGLALVSGGGAVAVGAKTVGAGTVGWAVRVNAAGGVLWDKEFALNGVALFYRVVPVATGGYLLLGRTETATGGAASADLAVVRINAAGSEVWKTIVSAPGYGAAHAALPWGDGWLVGGTATSATNGLDGQWTALNAQGGVLASSSLGGSKADEIHALAASAGAVVLAGYTASKGAGSDDGWLVRVDPFGNGTCAASGNCLADAAKCDDKNPCTVDTCSGNGGCSAVKVADGVVCGASQTCKAGVCGP